MATENMLLTLPTPLPSGSATAGPQYANENTQCFLTIDSHNHQIRRGERIPTAGISIDADLPFNEFNAIDLRSLRVQNLSDPIDGDDDLHSIYAVDGDFWFNDGNGVQIQLTDGNALNTDSVGSIGGDYVGSDASVYYTNASKKFFFTSDTNVAGKMDCGAITFRAVGVNAKGVTLTAPVGLAASYNFTLVDALPAAPKIARLSSSGVLTASLDADNSTTEIVSSNLRVKDLGISTAKIADAAVTNPKLGAFNYVVGASSGSYSVTGSTYTTIASVTITTNGRTVRVLAQPANASGSYFSVTGNLAGDLIGYAKLQRGSTDLAIYRGIVMAMRPAGLGAGLQTASGVDLDFYDITPAAGTYTYTLLGRAGGSVTMFVERVCLVAMELPA